MPIASVACLTFSLADGAEVEARKIRLFDYFLGLEIPEPRCSRRTAGRGNRDLIEPVRPETEQIRPPVAQFRLRVQKRERWQTGQSCRCKGP
jgi:hypothetical protein